MSLNPIDIASSFFEMGEDKSRVLFRGKARVFFALMEGTPAQTTHRDVGLLSELVVRAETVVRRDALFREQPRAVDVEVRIVLLQNSPVERGVPALCNQLCKCKIRFEVDAANENLIEREEIDFENIFLLPSDEIGIDYETRIGFRFVERMSWRKYLEKFQYGSRPSITLLTPSDNAVAINSSVVFSWNAVATFLDYTLEVSTNATFTTLVHTSTATTTSRTVVLENGWRYWWRVVATNSSETLVSSIRTFTTRLTAPTLTGFPSSIEVPTNSFFQGIAARGVANALATEAEFEWEVGATSQSNVSVFYNTSGNATGTFNLPSITAPTLIKVRARSKNAVVVGEWSPYVDIDVTLFRPTPIILSFTASQSRVALDAQPSSQVFFTIQFSYSDVFGGNCTWKIERVDNSQLISSGVQTGNPHFVSNISVPLPTVASTTVITYRLTVTNPNNQFVSSDININYFPRPSISNVFFFFNPNYQTYQDVSKSALANQNGHPVALIEDEIQPTRKVEQQTIADRPILVASGNRFYLESSVYGRNLRQPPSDNALPTTLSERNNFTWIMVGNFPNQTGEICQPINLSNSNTDIILGFFLLGNVLFRLGSSVSPDIVLLNSPINTWNIMQVVVVTYQINTTNGFKVYSSLYPTSNGRLVGQQNTTNNTLGGFDNDRMRICRSNVTNSLFPRRAGHIISFKRTLSQSEVLDWIDWLCVYYQITPAP